MGKTNERSYKYWVIFEPSKNPRWWSKFLDPYFGHVSIARVSNGGHFWIVLESCGGNVLTNIYSLCDIRKLYRDAVILTRWSTVLEKPTNRVFHLNCVEMAKLVLGIRKWNVITPYQLYKYIKEE